jgi:uncharacterized protein YecE (DUF72 family)
MHFFVGTSGFAYKEWKGSFYPEKLPQKEMLKFYAERFGAVEINGSFYRMPIASQLAPWAEEVPRGFQFAFKAPQAITHFKRLKDAEEATEMFCDQTAALKALRGPLLFGLPPNFKKDLPRLQGFLQHLDRETRIAFEYRHASWFDDEVFDCLRASRCALCINDEEKSPWSELVRTTDWSYLRLRREAYTDKSLAGWIEKLKAQKGTEAYVFFKHEETGTGPKLAARFLRLTGS